jgi:hypothetical protein
MHAPDFKSKLVRTRKELLLEIISSKRRKKQVASPTPRARYDTDPQPGRLATSAMSEMGNRMH